ncbi:MAG TPA: CehA/McbA family metallohydrolase [Methylomirabilota bacterium]|nr:CehA/McbA family metallohydrolase [Methylomirabilota bacterium]
MRTPLLCAIALLMLIPLRAAPLPIVSNVEWQPFSAQVKRVVQALEISGAPLPGDQAKQIEALLASNNTADATRRIQELLDARCLLAVHINPESRVKVIAGATARELDELGWRVFLIKVHNEAGVTAALEVASPQARALFEGGWASSSSDKYFQKAGERLNNRRDARDLWLDLETLTPQPLKKELSGLAAEYRLIQLYSRDAGKREAKLIFTVGQGTQDLGFRNELDLLFTARPARAIKLNVLDDEGKPTIAAFLIRDAQGRVYPAQSKRLAPDFGFHPQVYREHGEVLRLPDGAYTFEVTRGPESLPQRQQVTVSKDLAQVSFKMQRWIDPSKLGWWSGDHHIHAAGCAHYTNPSEGVHAPDMYRHCVGEDLKVGANLTWGPCFDYQKQFFTGKDDKVSKLPYLLRYDIEVSGFGSHQSGHLCLLRLKEQMYPGGDSKDHWPTLCLNTLKWAKRQGALVGPAHTGWGLEVNSGELPNYIVPPFNGIGAMEYIVDVTHQVPGPDGKLVPAVDFISMVDTPHIWELNIWYHTLNVGYRTRISGETDFPCIYGERVGLGRSYVKLDGELNYEAWCEGIRAGRNYVGDGRSHFLDFKVNDQRMGEGASELHLAKPGPVRVTAAVAAYLPERADPEIKAKPYMHQPYWHIERARADGTRQVPVELLVNGKPVASKMITADGATNNLSFDASIDQSSWVAMRVLPSSHTNPIFVLVDGKPIRASKRSAEWCLKSVDQCWSQKERQIKQDELDDARAAYDHARREYQRLLAESTAD